MSVLFFEEAASQRFPAIFSALHCFLFHMKTKSSLTADFKSVEQTPVMSHSFPREVKAREEGPFEHRVCLDRLFGSGARDKMRAPMNTT